MSLRPKEHLTEEEIERGLGALIKDGMASQAMSTLTGGVFLVALAFKLGASNFTIGLLAAIPPLTQLLQLPAIFVVERVRNRRVIVVLFAFLSRLPWLAIAAIPFLFPSSAAVGVVVGALAAHGILSSLAGCSWNSWMRDLIPEHRMGTFFSKRMRISMGLGLVLSLLAAGFLDWWEKTSPGYEVHGYSVLFLLGFLAGAVGVYFIAKIPEPKMRPGATHIFDALALPFKDGNFRRLLIFMGSWSFAVNLAAPFFTVYMLDRLQMGMSLVVALSVVSQVCNFSFLGIWGKFSDRHGNKPVLLVSGPLFALSIFAWAFTTLPERHLLTLPMLFLIHAIMGMATAGVTLGTANIGLKLAPRGQATAYLAVNTIISSIAAGIAPMIGGRLADFFSACNLSLTFQWVSPGQDFQLQALNFRHWDFFFGIAFLIALYALHRLTMVQETGEAEEDVVRQELMDAIKQPLRSLSSVAGLFQVISYPVSVARETLSGTLRGRKK